MMYMTNPMEITPQMIEAGVRAICEGRYYGLLGDLDRERFVTEIYLAMRAKDDSAEPCP